MNTMYKLFFIEDDERPMYVTAVDFSAALEAWRGQVASEDDSPDAVSADSIDPTSVNLICPAEELLIVNLADRGKSDRC